MRCPNSNRGFTLVELMIALTIIGILTTTTLVRLDFFGTEHNQELEHLVTTIRTQHAASLRQTTSYVVDFSSDENTVTIRSDGGTLRKRVSLSRWSITEAGTRRYVLTPWYVRGQPVELRSGDRETTLYPDDVIGVRREQ